MEGIKGGARRVGVGQAQDTTLEPTNHCIHHPHKNTNNGGICAFCLQEKLDKLVSSSQPPSPLDAVITAAAAGGERPATKDVHNVSNHNNGATSHQEYHTRRARNIPLPKKKIMVSSSSTTSTTSHHHDHDHHAITSRSTGRFWSFLYISSKTLNAKRTDKIDSNVNYNDDDDDDVRKVSRSRSVGCGSRSFSGDLFEKFSTGFGDCTLRRVESQRAPKPKAKIISDEIRNSSPRKWTFASPIRAFSSKKDQNSNTITRTTPNLSAIPSLLAT